MYEVRGVCKECGEEFFVDSENCGTDESLCDECFNYFVAIEEVKSAGELTKITIK